ncbi:MAG: response regulator [Candidatus Obscuribacterales bacterium]|jgi:CheY-like chemotaxis protein
MPSGLILFVEDDPTLQMVGKLSIKHLGYDCEVLNTGEKVVEHPTENVILIFMDIGLPGIDGREATKLIRAAELRENRKPVPIIALTGHAIRAQCLEVGMDDFLQKPALIEDLDLMIKKWVLPAEETAE